jgi:UDP-glucuronate 4-epimerase
MGTTRDFTFVDDIAEAWCAPATRSPVPTPGGEAPSQSRPPARLPGVFSIGSSRCSDQYPRARRRWVKATLGCCRRNRVTRHHADVRAASAAIGWRPATPVAEGVRRFVEWYRGYYGQ